MAYDRDSATPPSGGTHRRAIRFAGRLAGRSLFPLVALGLVLGTVLWGPWVTLVLAFAWWNVVTRVA